MTENQRKNWCKFCSEPLDKIEHYEEALTEDFKGWCIHHRLEIQQDKRVSRQELKDNGLYFHRPANELVFMRKPEHHRLHWIGNTVNKGKHLSEETCKKMSEAHKGENNPLFGKHLSEETCKKMSEAHKGKHLPTETRQKLSEAHKGKHLSEEHRQKMSESHKGKHLSEEHRKKLSEAHKGTRWWNNGISSKHAKECPGPEWKPGRL